MSADDDTFLDGLAGRPARPGSDAAHADGAGLRAALLDDAQAGGGTPALPDWSDVLAREAANDPVAGGAAAVGVVAHGGQGAPATVARPTTWLRWGAMAAAVLLAVPVLWLLMPVGSPTGGTGSEDEPHRGGPAAGAPAVWRSAQPAQDAQALAEALRAAGAQVTVMAAEAGGQALQIQADADHVAEVNTRLAPLDTALGVDGRLVLQVLPAR